MVGGGGRWVWRSRERVDSAGRGWWVGVRQGRS